MHTLNGLKNTEMKCSWNNFSNLGRDQINNRISTDISQKLETTPTKSELGYDRIRTHLVEYT